MTANCKANALDRTLRVLQGEKFGVWTGFIDLDRMIPRGLKPGSLVDTDQIVVPEPAGWSLT